MEGPVRPSRLIRAALPAALVLAGAALLQAQLRHTLPDDLDAAVRAIYERNEYTAESFGPTAWLEGGRRYTSITPGQERNLVAYDTQTGASEVLVASKSLVPAGATRPLAISGYSWSPDRTKLLIFTNTRKVWRQNTRGDYWTLDRASGALKKLGGDAPEASLMFAKFSPDGTRVAYVRAQNVYVEDARLRA